jgi:hypothetical protein
MLQYTIAVRLDIFNDMASKQLIIYWISVVDVTILHKTTLLIPYIIMVLLSIFLKRLHYLPPILDYTTFPLLLTLNY